VERHGLDRVLQIERPGFSPAAQALASVRPLREAPFSPLRP
jgi:hypothetical protein